MLLQQTSLDFTVIRHNKRRLVNIQKPVIGQGLLVELTTFRNCAELLMSSPVVTLIYALGQRLGPLWHRGSQVVRDVLAYSTISRRANAFAVSVNRRIFSSPGTP